jgi:hypothetical protein
MLFGQRTEIEEEITEFKRKIFAELKLGSLSKKDPVYEKRKIEFEEKLYEFKYNLRGKRCHLPLFKEEHLCKKNEADLLSDKDFAICSVKADQVWHQSSLAEDDLISEATKLYSSFDKVLERKKIWDDKKDCQQILQIEQGNLAKHLESLKEGRNYDPETCEWVSDLPRKVVNLPGCRDNKNNNICTGYVQCNQKEKFGSGKFIRLATCEKKLCVDGKAKAQDCVKQEGFSSYAPKGIKNESVSDLMMSELQD